MTKWLLLIANDEIDAGVPMNDDDDVKDEVEDSDQIGKGRFCLGLVEEFSQTANFQHPIESHQRRHVEGWHCGTCKWEKENKKTTCSKIPL